MKKKIIILSILIVSIIPTTIIHAFSFNQANTMIQDTISTAHLPLVSIAYLQDGKTSFQAFETTSFKQKIDESKTLFVIADQSQAFSALAIFLLEQNKKLKIEDPITKYIPNLKVMYRNTNISDTITIKDLLYQTSGLQDTLAFNQAMDQYHTLDSVFDNLEIDAATKPNIRFHDAAMNYTLIGYIIEKASGTSYPEYMDKNIFKPLGLKNTYADMSVLPHPVLPAVRRSFWLNQSVSTKANQNFVAARGIVSSTHDLALWTQMQMHMIKIPTNYYEAMRKTHIPNINHPIDKNINFAAGWYVDAKTSIVSMYGSHNHHAVAIQFHPQKAFGTVALTNIDTPLVIRNISSNVMKLYMEDTDFIIVADRNMYIDTVFSIVSVFTIIGSIFILYGILHRLIRRNQYTKTKKNILLAISCIILLLLVISLYFIIPNLLGLPWHLIYQRYPFSFIIAIVFLFILLFLSSIFLLFFNSKKHEVRT